MHGPGPSELTVSAPSETEVAESRDSDDFLTISKEDPEKKMRMLLFQDRAMQTLKSQLQKPSFVVLMVAPSGHGKSHAIENLTRDFQILTEADCDEDDNFETLLRMSQRQGLKKTLVVIDNIEGLDTSRKRALTHFLKKELENPLSKVRMILTSDSAYEAPTKSLKTAGGITLINFMKYSNEDISSIVSSYARSEFNVVLSGPSIDKIVSLSQGNPRAAIQTFDFSYRTKHVKHKDASTDRSRDVMPNLIS